MSVYGDRSEALQREGYNCCQCLVGCLCEEFGIDRVTAFRFSSAFGSGIGGSAETCGAVTGAMMVIGLKYSKLRPAEPQSERAYELAELFLKRFREAYEGRTICRELLGADASTDEGWEYIMENDLHNRVCRGIIRTGAEIIAELMLEDDSNERD